MRIGILQFPGAAINISTHIKQAGMDPCEINWTDFTKQLPDYEGYFIAGDVFLPPSFSLIEALKAKAHKTILGIGYGADILIRSGLIPGVENNKPCITLIDQQATHTHMKLSHEYQRNAFTLHLNAQTIFSLAMQYPAKFVIPPALLIEIKLQGLNVLEYCDNQGKINSAPPIAAISNKIGNVMAMLAYPQTDTFFFHSMRSYIQEGYVQKVAPLHYYPRNDSR